MRKWSTAPLSHYIMEEMVGKAIADGGEDSVLTTKVYRSMSDERNHQGGSRSWLVTELDNSLRRINADHINREIAGRKIFR
ncbi:MAG TPA: aldo/keto reductase [Ktedonobacteraceae bacterium]|nr:aldo/keto reductase [Ktedonobacteraceae bacterium]